MDNLETRAALGTGHHRTPQKAKKNQQQGRNQETGANERDAVHVSYRTYIVLPIAKAGKRLDCDRGKKQST